ncbi:MAG: type-F conjugative transfer system pilin assembly protein TrbC [Gammaproteobacteria bacterium]|nr:type-F conjugative transfer system pilin assembly protein TrbC [Gammaproteobacteria bacterium]
MNHRSIATISSILVLLCITTSFAGDTNDLINRERLRREKEVKEILKEKDGFTKYKKVSVQKMEDYQEIVKTIKDKHVKNTQLSGFIKPAPQAIIFVSLSMPNLSLQQTIQDSVRYQVPIVIRGLYKNSFRKTMEKIFDLIKEKNKGGILINPVWFKKYDIKVVPAVVVSQGDGIDGKNYDVIYGNIPLKRALTLIAERGDVSKVAKDILNRSGI